jgi:hypothetical protein
MKSELETKERKEQPEETFIHDRQKKRELWLSGEGDVGRREKSASFIQETLACAWDEKMCNCAASNEDCKTK